MNLIKELLGNKKIDEASNKMTINIDVADWTDKLSDAQLDKEMENLAKKYHCTVKLHQRVGPAGGNPNYDFTGTEENLRKMYVDGNIGDAEEFDEFYL